MLGINCGSGMGTVGFGYEWRGNVENGRKIFIKNDENYRLL